MRNLEDVDWCRNLWDKFRCVEFILQDIWDTYGHISYCWNDDAYLKPVFVMALVQDFQTMVEL